MSFELFTPLFDKIDQVTTAFVTEISSRAITAITPVVSVGLTLGFITYGILIIRGAVDLPLMDFLKRSIQISIITSLALSSGLYQQSIAEVIRATPDELVTSLIPTSSQTTSNKAASIIDQAAETGFAKAGEAFDCAGFFKDNGILYGLFGVMIILTTSALIAIGGAILLLTKICLSILAGLGPFFIVSLLWKPTAKFFDMWVAQLINYILLIVLFSAIFGLMISIFSSYMEDMAFDGEASIAQSLGGGVILSIAMVVILLQLPRLASGLAGGVSLGYLYELHAIRGAAASVSSSRGGGASYSASDNKRGSGGYSSDGVGGRGSSRNRIAYGYFKGKSNKAGER